MLSTYTVLSSSPCLHRHSVQTLQLSSFGTHAVSVGPSFHHWTWVFLPTLTSLDASPSMIMALTCLVDIPCPFHRLVAWLNHLDGKQHLFNILIASQNPFRISRNSKFMSLLGQQMFLCMQKVGHLKHVQPEKIS